MLFTKGEKMNAEKKTSQLAKVTKFIDWVDVKNPEFLKACNHLDVQGCWPEGFLPEDMELPITWHSYLTTILADAYLKLMLGDSHREQSSS